MVLIARKELMKQVMFDLYIERGNSDLDSQLLIRAAVEGKA